jgi:hypothetical protein
MTSGLVGIRPIDVAAAIDLAFPENRRDTAAIPTTASRRLLQQAFGDDQRLATDLDRDIGQSGCTATARFAGSVHGVVVHTTKRSLLTCKLGTLVSNPARRASRRSKDPSDLRTRPRPPRAPSCREKHQCTGLSP